MKEDFKIRKYIKTRKATAGISRILIERTDQQLIITIDTSRPGVIFGPGGADIQSLEKELTKLLNKDIRIEINKINNPELVAVLVAENIAAQLKAKGNFRRSMKFAIQATKEAGAQGIKVMCSGRLGGSEMARTEIYKEGRTPLHTLRADIDYATAEALTIYGIIGVKV